MGKHRRVSIHERDRSLTGQQEYEGLIVGGVEIPPPLAKAVAEHSDALEIALQCILDLPKNFRDSFSNYFDSEWAEEGFVDLVAAMKSLREGKLPSRDGFMSIAGPRTMLLDLASGLKTAATFFNAVDNRSFLPQAQLIAERLEEAARAMTWEGAYSVTDWAWETSDALYPLTVPVVTDYPRFA